MSNENKAKARRWGRDILERARRLRVAKLQREKRQREVPQWLRDLAERDFRERLKGGAKQ